MAKRDSKGRFLPRQKAMVVRKSGHVAKRGPAVVTVRTVAVEKKAKGKGRRGGSGVVTDIKAAGAQVVYGGAYGWLSNSPQTAQALDRLPTVSALGKHLTRGVIIYLVNRQFIKNKHVARIAIAAATVGGYALGAGAARGGFGAGPAVLGGSIGDGDDLIGDGDVLLGEDDELVGEEDDSPVG